TAGRRRRVYRFGNAVRWVGTAIDTWHRLLPLAEGDVNGAAIGMGMLNHYYDSSKAAEQLGYHRRETPETLSDAWQWLNRE
ncbi:MAG: hypothetical protein KDA45_03165, partial [Planctomycetales bacterium]|nr:hypothetical protein [Planctomycetales bacterium]